MRRCLKPRLPTSEEATLKKSKILVCAIALFVLPLSACGSDSPERSWIDDYGDTASETELAYARSGTNHPAFNLAVASSAVIADGQITVTGFNDSAMQYKDVPMPYMDVPAGNADRTVDRKPLDEWMGDLHKTFEADKIGDHNPNASISLSDQDGNAHAFAIELTDVVWDGGTGTAVLSFNPLEGETIPDGSYNHVSLQIDGIPQVIWYCGWTIFNIIQDVLSDGETAVIEAVKQVKTAFDCVTAIMATWFSGD